MKLTTTSIACSLLLFSQYALSMPMGEETGDLQVQAGYHVIYSYTGATPPNELVTYIEQGLVGGVVLFGDNVNDNLTDTVDTWQSAYTKSPGYNGSPILILTDQEGGLVSRLPGGPNCSEKEIGASSNPEHEATTAGLQAASTLKNYKLNANLAPVLDVFRVPGDFDDQYERSYSQNATLAGISSAAFITAQQGSGVLATAKHFPGLGAASSNANTDEVPVILNNVSISDMRSIDEVPYHAAIKAGVDMVMPSWAFYPQFDSQYPSGLSSKLIQSELRGRLGFMGVTISDAIEAGALQSFGDDPNRAVLATRAGMDIILAGSKNVTQGLNIVTELANQLTAGSLNQTAFDEATDRILSLRKKLVSS